MPFDLRKALDELVAEEAKARAELHAGHSTALRKDDEREIIGLAGEVEFGDVFHQPVDFSRRLSGDGGIDFIIPLRFTVDVKAACNPTYLIVPVGAVVADIYVLAKYIEPRKTPLLGWEWGTTLRQAPTRDFGYGVVNHYIPQGELKKMKELGDRIMHLR